MNNDYLSFFQDGFLTFLPYQVLGKVYYSYDSVSYLSPHFPRNNSKIYKHKFS